MVNHESADFYADPHVYDVLHRPGTRAEATLYLRLMKRHLPRDYPPVLTLLEPASGTGRYLVSLAKHGHHRGIGIDLSADMNAYARAAAKREGVETKLRFLSASMERFTLARACAHAAFNPINSIRHLHTDAAMLEHLRLVARALKPGGVYLVGLELSDPATAQPSEDVWIGRERGLRVQQNVSYLPPEGRSRMEQVISHLTITSGTGRTKIERHIDSHYNLRTYTHTQWQTLLRKAGYEIVAAYGASGRPKVLHSCTLGYFLWMLRPLWAG